MNRFFSKYKTWEEAEKAWDARAKEWNATRPLKTPKHLPKTPRITQETKRHLKFKSLKYLLTHDNERLFVRYFFKRPLKYALSYLKSALKKKLFTREGDLTFFGFKNKEAFKTAREDPNALLIVGFSFCHKPLECPDERFNEKCRADPEHPVCRQCFIGKVKHALPEERTTAIVITTIYDIGKKIFETVEENPQKKIIFLITACELSLEMFADFGHMVGIQGVGVILAGRICNTFRAFALAEKGIKPGLTLISKKTQYEITKLLKTNPKQTKLKPK